MPQGSPVVETARAGGDQQRPTAAPRRDWFTEAPQKDDGHGGDPPWPSFWTRRVRPAGASAYGAAVPYWARTLTPRFTTDESVVRRTVTGPQADTVRSENEPESRNSC
jgi:hypothetical protein